MAHYPLHQMVRSSPTDGQPNVYNQDCDEGVNTQTHHLIYSKVDIQVGLSANAFPSDLFNWDNSPAPLIPLNRAKKTNHYQYIGRATVIQSHHPRIIMHNHFNGVQEVPREPRTVLNPSYCLFPLMTGQQTLIE